MTPMVAEFHQAHKMRRLSWAARAVPDDGIDLKRVRRGFRFIGEPVLPPAAQEEPPTISANEAPTAPADLPSAVQSSFLARRTKAVVAHRYGITIADLESAKRTWRHVRPRQIAMYLAKTITQRSLPWIGGVFGGRDHTTALHSIRKIRRLALADMQLGADLAALECIIRRRGT